MDTLVTISIVVCAVGVSSVIARFVRMPLPLIQIALGALLALPRVGRGVELEPNIFLAGFVAPLLFTDAWQTSKREFVRAWKTIVLLAFGLALVTVAGTGLFVHWLVPAIGIPSAFALAAALAPTDVVAVQSIARASPLPRPLMHIIEGEGLLNDATGLVALRFAVAAALTGTFHPVRAALDLVVTALGGLALGAVAALLVFGVLQRLWSSRNADNATILVVLPFPSIVFVVAEHLHLSGVLAAVAAGLVGEVVSRRFAEDQAMRLSTLATWSMLGTGLNGAIFVILGMQLPAILGVVPEVAATLGLRHPLVLLGYVVGITWSLLAVRGL